MSPEKEIFHVVIRIPIKRPKGFIEPPSIIWTDEMEHKLWQYMSQKNTDWNEIAEQLGVPTSYIVRHAAFIYETQLRGIQQQLRLNGNASMSRNSAKSPTLSLKRPTSIRYSNAFQQQYQLTSQEPDTTSSIPQKHAIQQESSISRNIATDSMLISNTSSRVPVEITDPSPQSQPTQIGRSPSQSSLYKSSSSHVNNDTNKYINDETEDDDDDGNQTDNNKDNNENDDDEEEFSSHFERIKLQVEEPAFLPRRLDGSSSNLNTSRQQLSLSIQNLRKPSNAYVAELPPFGSPKKVLSPQSHSPAIRPSTTASGSNNNSAINSSTSSFSDISESSVTQSAMEDAFLSNFNHGSKMSLMSFSRKYKE